MNKQQLASKIWQSANKMRSKIEANEYKDYILGFIFYKFLSDKEKKWLKEQDYTDKDIKDLKENNAKEVKFIQNGIGYFIAYDNLFSTWLDMGSYFKVSNVYDALSAFNRNISNTHNKVFENIFNTLQTGLSKLGENAGKQTSAIQDLLQLIRDIPMDGKQDYDVLGFIYEYLIGNFAANAGKKAGEFYTPHEVSLLMSEIIADHLKDKETIEIYDPTSGSGSLLINIGKSAAKYNGTIKYYAQELKENTYNLTRMNLVMRGIGPSNIKVRNGDTLEDDWPYFEDNANDGTYTLLNVDAVVSNPPYSQEWKPSDKDNDPRFKRFGLAPKTKADYAFLLHDLYHLKPDGIMAIVLPHGVLFRGDPNSPDGEGKIRKKLIEYNNIETIIGLPANIFFGTGIPTIIMILRQKRKNTDVLFVDASKGFIKDGNTNKLRASDIKKITDTVTKRIEIEKYSRIISRDEIRSNAYNLNIPRYVDSSPAPESWDIYASMFGGIPQTEIESLHEYWSALPNLQNALFQDVASPYLALKTDNIKQTIIENDDVKKLTKKVQTSFKDFDSFLKTELIEQCENVNLAQEETTISEDIFKRLKNIPLIDKYKAYQSLDDEWQIISSDIEIIQSEGFDCTKIVDPNMVMKKKDGKEVEIQEGWKGRMIPFELVQNTLLKKETDALKAKEQHREELSSSLEEIIESLGEDEKEKLLNDDNSAFVNAELNKAIKEQFGTLAKATQIVKSYDEDSFERKIVQAAEIIDNEKQLKAEIKKETDKLHMLTKETIEKLNDAQVKELLESKWITPLVNAMHDLPNEVIANLITKIEALSKKYAVTYHDIANQISNTEKTIANMIDNLTGSTFDMKGLAEYQNLLTRLPCLSADSADGQEQ
jgi:type I restriction enzyme M protein